jgi:hypothetical protein
MFFLLVIYDVKKPAAASGTSPSSSGFPALGRAAKMDIY